MLEIDMDTATEALAKAANAGHVVNATVEYDYPERVYSLRDSSLSWQREPDMKANVSCTCGKTSHLEGYMVAEMAQYAAVQHALMVVDVDEKVGIVKWEKKLERLALNNKGLELRIEETEQYLRRLKKNQKGVKHAQKKARAHLMHAWKLLK